MFFSLNSSVNPKPLASPLPRPQAKCLVRSVCVKLLYSAVLSSGVALFGQSSPQLRQQSSTIVDMGQISARNLNQTLGIGIGPNGLTQDWQFAAAKSLGASWVRIQCSWQSVEQQSNAPADEPSHPRYVQTPPCVAALSSAAKYGLRVTSVAAYGPPYHALLYAVLPNGAQAGQTSIQIASVGGINSSTLANMRPIYDYICPARLDDNGEAGKNYGCLGGVGRRGGPAGTLITGVHPTDATHATLELASAVSKTLPGNVRSPQRCSIEAGNNVLTCADGTFDASWSGIQISVPGAGSRGMLTTVVTQASLPTQLKLRINATRAVSNIAVAANRVYVIGEILYPSTGTDRADDPSVKAYADYATFLADDMAARGVSGDVEIWNEPPWANDPWDFRPALYDSANSGPYKAGTNYSKGAVASLHGTLYLSIADHNQGNTPSPSSSSWSRNIPSDVFPGDPISGANYGFAANIQHRPFPPNVTATWNGTSGSSSASLLGPQMLANSGEALQQPSTVITRESSHPYGGAFTNPEDVMVRPDCIRSAARSGGSIFKSAQDCFLPGEHDAANLMQAVVYDAAAKLKRPDYGIGHSVTETNAGAPGPGFQVQQARSDLRQLLGLASLGISPIEFFQMWDGGHHDPTFSFVDYDGTHMTPLPSYTAIATLMSDVRAISSPARASLPSATLSVAGYSGGTFPLATVHITGARAGASAATDMLVVWQISAAPGFTASIAGNTLQISAFASGLNVIAPGELLEGKGVPPGTTISAGGSGSGGTGSYQLSGHPPTIGREQMNVNWMTLPQPAPGTVTLGVPAGLHITAVIDLLTRKAVPYHGSGSQVTLAVQDDPIAVVADPR